MSPLIPYTSSYSPSDILTESSDLVRTWRIEGLPFETVSREDIDRSVAALHNFVHSFCGERVAIYQHTAQRKQQAPDLLPSFDNDYARSVCTEYQRGVESSDLFVVDLYLTIVYRCETQNSDGKIAWFGNMAKKAASSVDEIQQSRKEGHAAMVKIGRSIETTLADYRPSLLRDYTDDYGSTISEQLSFTEYLITRVGSPVQRSSGVPLWDYLGSGSYTAGFDLIELRVDNRSRYAQMIDMKRYPQDSYAGVLNDLYRLDVEFVSCVVFCGMQDQTAANVLDKKARNFEMLGDYDNANEVRAMRDGLLNEQYGVGDLSVTICVVSDTQQGAYDDAEKLMAVLRHRGLKPDTAKYATDGSFFSQLPGNFVYRPRASMYTTQNLCDLMPMHNHHEGKAKGNPWGNAVMPLRTQSNRLVYLNLHEVQTLEDVEDSKPAGSFVGLGRTGGGKTTLMNMINLFLRQFSGFDTSILSVTLDIKQGCRRTIESMHGSYSAVKNGEKTGYSPFKMDSTPGNIIFLTQMVVHLCSQDGNRVTTDDRADIGRAVHIVMRQPKEHRGFSLLLQSLTTKPGENSLRARLVSWASNDGRGNVGSNAWALDNDTDGLDFSENSVFGIDGTDLLENPIVRTPVLMYLLYRIRQVLGTRRVAVFIDEFWQWLGDDDVTKWVSEALATIRSKDGIVGLFTQMPESILQSPAGTAIARQAPTLICLKDSKARFDVYEKFGVTEKEFRVMMNLPDYHFLYKQDKNSVTATADISALSAENRAIIAG